MKNIKYLFWNIYKKNLIGPLLQVILENDIDIVALVEAETLDVQGLLNSLKIESQEWKKVEICPDAETDICVLAKSNIHIVAHKEEKRYATYKIYQSEDVYLFSVVHLPSAMYMEESARDTRAMSISRLIGKVEEAVFVETEYKSIIVGDFNLQPYSQGIAGVDGFNGTMSISQAKKISRKVEGEKKYFYFNPTWKLMGDNKAVQGSYYNSSDQQGKSIYWYSFDELLIRPYFIDKFNWEYFGIIEEIEDGRFIANDKINKEKYSDHLPIKFEID